MTNHQLRQLNHHVMMFRVWRRMLMLAYITQSMIKDIELIEQMGLFYE